MHDFDTNINMLFTYMKRANNILRIFNNFLTLVNIALVFYIFAAPIVPQISFWAEKNVHEIKKQAGDPSASKVSETNTTLDTNTLVIPALYLNETIYEGQYADTLSKGVWHRPRTSSPDVGGNTVLAGHRFMYRKGSVFYHLDKLKVGDEIIVYWDSAEYKYKVDKTYIVNPNAIEIENDTSVPRLTLYTCTPLWTVQNRLVIRASLTESKP